MNSLAPQTLFGSRSRKSFYRLYMGACFDGKNELPPPSTACSGVGGNLRRTPETRALARGDQPTNEGKPAWMKIIAWSSKGPKQR